MSLVYEVSEYSEYEWLHNQAVSFKFNSAGNSVVVKSLQNFSTPGIYRIIRTFPVLKPILMTVKGCSNQGNAFLWAYIVSNKTRLTTNYTLLPLDTTGSVSTTFTLPSWATDTLVHTGVLFTAPHIGDEFTLDSLSFTYEGGGCGGGGGGGGGGSSTTSLSINNNIYLDKVLEFSKNYLCGLSDYDCCSDEESKSQSDELPTYNFDECHAINCDSNFVRSHLIEDPSEEILPISDSLQKDLESLFKIQETLTVTSQNTASQNECLNAHTSPTSDIRLSTFDSFLSSII